MRPRKVDSDKLRVELAHTLRDLRVSHEWRQLDLAERCGIDTRTLSAYERGTRTPPLEALVAIFDAYGLLLVDALHGVYPFGATQAPRRREPPERSRVSSPSG